MTLAPRHKDNKNDKKLVMTLPGNRKMARGKIVKDKPAQKKKGRFRMIYYNGKEVNGNGKWC